MRESVPCAAAVLLLAAVAVGQPEKKLPPDLILVPAGAVPMGRTAAQLAQVASQLHPDEPERRRRALRQMLAELGPQRVQVARFFLNRYQVTNEQYHLFVQATGHRFPFHWWKFGKPEDYASRRRAYRSEYSGRTRPELDYWEAHWADLPYAVPAEAAKQPVRFVSWRDAVAFAAWAGMRLPTEAEWQRAAAGDASRDFLVGDAWDPQWFAELKAHGMGALHDVGAAGAPARGAFGHEDMVGNVWEWTDTRYRRLVAADVFGRELSALRRQVDGIGDDQPHWDDKEVLKGGSYLSTMNPVELRVGSRAPLEPYQTVEAAGLRLAKSPQPGRDLCRYRLHHDHRLHGPVEGYDLEAQIGVERYELDESGLVRGYHSVSVVPVAPKSLPPETSHDAVLESMRRNTAWIGALVTTEPLAEPALAPGAYAISYRARGLGADSPCFYFIGPDNSSVPLVVDQPDPSLATTEPKSTVHSSIDKNGAEWLHFSFAYRLSEDRPRHLAMELSVRRTPR